MAAHIGVTSHYGITLPDGAECVAISKTSTVEISELMDCEGEFVKADALHHKKVEVAFSFVGAPMHDSVAVGDVALPATMTITKSDATESNAGRVSCSITAAGHESFTDAGTGASPGEGEAGPDEDTLNLVSCTLALAESVQVTKEVQDKVLIGYDGAPAARATHSAKNSFAVKFKGDIPAGVVLGLSGVGVYGLTGGKLIVSKLMEEQKNDDFNGGSIEGSHYPSAA